TLSAQGEVERNSRLGDLTEYQSLDKGTLTGSDPVNAVTTVSERLLIAQSTAVETERIAGYTVIDCHSAQAESWLLGASTATGRNSLLFLLNPTGVPTPVD